MLRPFRATDAPRLFELLERHFPEEHLLLGYHRDVFVSIVRRTFRWDFRILMGLAALVRKPIVKFFVLEEDGKMAASTLVAYAPLAGYIALVMVDTPYRGRGYAKRLLAAAEDAARASGRKWAVLDVLTANAPARHLYESLGYRPLRSQGYFSLDLSKRPAVSGPPPSLPPGIRVLTRNDGDLLAKVAEPLLPPQVALVLPRANQFYLTPAVTLQLRSKTEAWVIDRGQGPEAFVRATTTPLTEAAHLTSPVVGPAVSPELARQLVEVANDWVAREGAPRIVLEVPYHNERGLAALRDTGYREAFPIETLYHAIAP